MQTWTQLAVIRRRLLERAGLDNIRNPLAQKPPLALRLIKEGLEKSFDSSLKEVLDWEAAHQSIALQTPEHKEIVKMFMDAKGNKG